MNFADVVGLDSVKQALLLLAVEPRLGGCVMAAPVGSGKSTLARAFAQLQPDGAPFVELPLNSTEDRLIGGLDLEATLATGVRALETGLLARAHGGALYVDGINLLDGALEAALIDTLSRGEVRIERDGLSATQPAAFVMLATYDPREGDLRRGLVDRVGLIAPFTSATDAAGRADVLRAHVADSDAADSADALTMLRTLLAEARTRLSRVTIEDAQLVGLATLAVRLGVEGNRADVFAAHAALAAAALGGREHVDDDDLSLAAKFVLLPRATRLPEEQQTAEQQQPEQPQPQQHAEQPEDSSEPTQTPAEQAPVEAMLLSALQTDLPADVLSLPFAQQRRSRSGSRGAALNARRGRFISAIQAPPRAGRIAVLHTLMAAAPWQALRAQKKVKGDRATVKAAAGPLSPLTFHLLPSDVRMKRYRDKAGTLFVFVVDASGSMALNRMREAKGAAAALLQNAYVHRDQVALIACRGSQSQVLLPPSTSVDRAKRELDVLPTGGATPLAHALLSGWQLARQMRGRGVTQASLVLMTDGRGNVPLRASQSAPSKAALQDELNQLAGMIRADGVQSIVIDTQSNYLSRGEGPALARALDGRYVYLPNAKAAQIAHIAAGARQLGVESIGAFV
jgi:magnesium chelatase subunit D